MWSNASELVHKLKMRGFFFFSWKSDRKLKPECLWHKPASFSLTHNEVRSAPDDSNSGIHEVNLPSTPPPLATIPIEEQPPWLFIAKTFSWAEVSENVVWSPKSAWSPRPLWLRHWIFPNKIYDLQPLIYSTPKHTLLYCFIGWAKGEVGKIKDVWFT